MQLDIDSLKNNLDKEPLDALAAYRECLIVMLHCVPLRLNELLSIIPDTVEVWHTMEDGTKRYSWQVESSSSRNKGVKAVALIPEHLVPLAQKAISRLRELQSKLSLKNLKSLANDNELRDNCSKIRRQYAEAISGEFLRPSLNDQFGMSKKLFEKYIDV